MTPLTLLKILAAYLVPTLMGLVLLSWLERGRQKLGGLEKAALAFALGIGIVSFYLFYVGLLGIRFSFPVVTAVFWPFLIGGVYMAVRGGSGRILRFSRPRILSRKGAPSVVLVVVLAALLLWKFSCACFIALSVPTYFDDSVSFWNHKAKVYYEQRGIVREAEHPDFFGGPHPYYPNGIPLFKCWVAVWAGEWREQPVNLVNPVFWLCLGALFYSGLRRHASALVSFAAAYMLLSVPLLAFHAGFAYMDLAVGFYFLGGVVYLYRWIGEGDRFSLIISALLLGVGLSVKEEMVPLFWASAVPVMVLRLFTSKLKPGRLIGTAALFLCLAVGPNLPWFIAKVYYGLQFSLGPEYIRFQFHPGFIGPLAYSFFDSGNYNIAWTLFFAALLASLRLAAGRPLKYLLMIILLALAVTLGAFIFTPLFAFLANGMTFNRSMLAILPALLFYSVLAYSGLAGEAARADAGGRER
ncbi:MAG: hypothetical protein P9M00_10915 [Candidatus Tritonobacter lacicola]|nr:hypothetical protein [Candidatus Tritonobacter lacicola]